MTSAGDTSPATPDPDTTDPDRSDPTSTFTEMMTLAPHGPDTFVGTGPLYPWGGLYGGQIVAQALGAAAATVEPRYRVHSLHAYFIRRGDQAEPVRYEVARTRNGRSFCTRTVEARQAVGAILSLSASFQVDEDAPEVQVAGLPRVTPPEEIQDSSWSPFYDRRSLPPEDRPGEQAAWMRATQLSPDEEDGSTLHAAALAYISDDLATDAAHSLDPRHADDWENLAGFSLDHAIWFHRPLRADEWHLHTMRCHGLMSSRGLAVGEVFTATGTHVATVTQEVLLRARR